MAKKNQKEEKIKTAVVTGVHSFDVPTFHAIFRSMPEVDFYPQDLNDFVANRENAYEQYDVVVFYIFHQPTPGHEYRWYEKGRKEALEKLGETEQGIFVLHHAILAFPDWLFWSEICGIEDRHMISSTAGETMNFEIANSDHPITQGLSNWEMVEEPYEMNDAGDGSDILITANHPKSMKTIAWARNFKKARVFCYQSGHDNTAFSHPQFRTIVSRGIQWVAGRI